MGFDSKKFLSAQFSARDAEVDLSTSDLSQYFKGNGCKWKVRGLNGQELFLCNQRAEKRQDIRKIIDGLASRSGDKTKDSILDLLEIGPEDIPEIAAKRIEYLIAGSVDPDCKKSNNHRIAVKIFENYPIEFIKITDKIIELTGLGYQAGKVKPSGTTGELEQQ